MVHMHFNNQEGFLRVVMGFGLMVEEEIAFWE